MSRIALSPPASGTATFTLSTPATNTDRTLTLPDTTAPILAGSGITLSASAPANTLVTTDAGNVGIGTSAPAAPLHVRKDQAAATYIMADNVGTVGASTSSGFACAEGGVASSFFRSVRDGTGQAQLFNVGAAPLVFGTNNTERMRIDSAGNVGIGTSSPDIFSRGYTRTVGINSSGITMLQLNGTTYSGADFGFNGTRTANIIAEAGGFYVQTNATAPLIFGTNFTERMRIDSSGNLLVGKTSPAGNLFGFEARQTGVAMVAANLSGPAGYFNRQSDNGQLIQLSRGNIIVGSIDVTTTATSYVTSSDYRLKHDIQPMTGALAKVQQLKPVTYKWNADDSESQGFIAHELQEVVPECVTGEKDAVNEDGSIKPQGIDTSFLVATLTAAIQELNAKVDAQAAEIAALKGQA